MDITWYGHACFLLKGSTLSVVTDPFDDSFGYRPGKLQAELVTISGSGPRHSYVERVGDPRKVLTGPGEYEISEVFILGIRTFRDAKKGAERGKNTAYHIKMDGLTICHLGAIGHVPTSDQASAIGDVDVLLVPVGGGGALTPSQAVETIALLEPKVIIPMLYKTEATTEALDPLDAFLKEQGVTGLTPAPKLSVSASTIPAGPQVTLLEYRQR